MAITRETIKYGYELLQEGDYQEIGDWFYSVGWEILELAEKSIDQPNPPVVK